MITPAVVKPAVLQIGADVPLLREALERKYDFYALGEQEDQEAFLAQKGASIRGVVTCTHPECDSAFVDRELVSKLPNLEIVSSFYDTDVKKVVDVHVCKKLGVHVTDTRDALANKYAANAIRLLMAISREVNDAGRCVRACRWPAKGNYPIPFRSAELIPCIQRSYFLVTLAGGAKGEPEVLYVLKDYQTRSCMLPSLSTSSRQDVTMEVILGSGT